MTGTTWIEESGILDSPILITNTHSVGVVRDAVAEFAILKGAPQRFRFPPGVGTEHHPRERGRVSSLGELEDRTSAPDLEVVTVGAEAQDVVNRELVEADGEHGPNGRSRGDPRRPTVSPPGHTYRRTAACP